MGKTQKQPKAPMPPQTQPKPGLDSEMDPQPRYQGPALQGGRQAEGDAALITGGDSGIGRSVAVLYAREGADVAIVYLARRAVRRRGDEGGRREARAGSACSSPAT